MSNLLEKASIITTPTAYSDGKLHSVKPVKTFGSELVTNETSGTVNTGGVYTDIITNINATLGQKLQVTYTLTGIESDIQIWSWTNYTKTYSPIHSIDGTYNATISVTGNNSSLDLRFYSPLGRTGTISNISVKEITDADFDFQRGSAATRVNSKGLIENVQTLSGNLVQNGDFSEIGSEEVVNGDFATDSNWSKGTGWSIANGVANVNNISANHLSQDGIVSDNNTYAITFTILNYSSGSIRLRLGNTYGGYTSGNGTYTQYIQCTGSDKFRVYSSPSGATLSIDNVSVKEVGQNWNFGGGWSIGDGKAINDGTINQSLLQTNVFTIGKSYKINFTISDVVGSLYARIWMATGGAKIEANANGNYTTYWEADGTDLYTTTLSTNTATYSITNISVIEITDDTDLPRIDYTDGCGSLLLEPQRTNIFDYSSDLSAWSKLNSTVTESSVLSLDGINNSYGYERTSSSSSYIYRTVSLSNTTVYTLSFFVKSGTSTNLRADIWDTTQSTQCQIQVDLVTKTVSNFNGTSYKIEDYTNGWMRISVTFTSESSFGTTFNRYWNADSVGTELYIWGAQLEQGSYPTSYIPTNGSTATRLADVCNNAGSSDLINSTEGVLYAEISALADDATNRSIAISDNSSVNRIVLKYDNQSNIIQCFNRINSVETAFLGTTVSDITQFNKIAVKFKLNDYALWVNGTEVDTDNTSTVFPSSTLNYLSFDNGAGADNFYGNVKSLVVFKEALTDDELEGLTGEGYDTFNALALANNYTII